APLPLRPALIPSSAQPAVELLLDRPLDDQPGPEPRELGQHPLRVIDHPLPQQLLDTRLYLRRWRYGASHGVGLLHRLAGLEGTYAVALTAPARIYSSSGTRPRRSRYASLRVDAGVRRSVHMVDRSRIRGARLLALNVPSHENRYLGRSACADDHSGRRSSVP